MSRLHQFRVSAAASLKNTREPHDSRKVSLSATPSCTSVKGSAIAYTNSATAATLNEHCKGTGMYAVRKVPRTPSLPQVPA